MLWIGIAGCALILSIIYDAFFTNENEGMVQRGFDEWDLFVFSLIMNAFAQNIPFLFTNDIV